MLLKIDSKDLARNVEASSDIDETINAKVGSKRKDDGSYGIFMEEPSKKKAKKSNLEETTFNIEYLLEKYVIEREKHSPKFSPKNYYCHSGLCGNHALCERLCGNFDFSYIERWTRENAILENQKVKAEFLSHLANVTCFKSLFLDGITSKDGSNKIILCNLLHVLKNNVKLVYLWLTHNYMDDDDVTSIMDILNGKHVNLLEIGLYRNNITKKGAVAIARLLRSSFIPLRIIRLGNNKIANGAIDIFEALVGNDSLREIYLEDNYIESNVVTHLLDALSKNVALRILDLRDNRIDVVNALRIVTAFTNGKTSLHALLVDLKKDENEDLIKNTLDTIENMNNSASKRIFYVHRSPRYLEIKKIMS